MTLLIGTDEAGYGPNLGPLLISATAWQVSDDDANIELYDRLSSTVRADVSSSHHIPIADSKQLYKPGGGLQNLERGLFAALSSLGVQVQRWRDAWGKLTPKDAEQLQLIPWYRDYDTPLPIDLTASQQSADHMRLTQGLLAAQVSLKRIRSTAMFPTRFNELVAKYGSKGSVLSLATLELVRDALVDLDASKAVVQCDKHGGRNRYLAVLQTIFPDEPVKIIRESRESSVYRWSAGNREVEIRFVAKGESFLPAALASMTSKYLRELAMRAFNEFWRESLPNLKPTAGYPMDARRFKAEIEVVQKKLGIADEMLWRCK
ncbi:MAG: hypothetical protein H6822_13305 [Planctomycetaceae bacterium]|nr:hypothetical protein [Planctomycetales bacterium]MCB9923155.1 hypothetical protein [Planctomycetaceae bacterium]